MISTEYDKHCEEFDKLYDQIVIEALEIAFQEIDNENIKNSSKVSPKLIRDFDELQVDIDPIYENLDDILIEKTIANITSEKLDGQNNMKILDTVDERKASTVKVTVPKKSILKIRSTDKQNDFTPLVVEESHYQVPNSEPYYEVPKTKPVPLYENIEMFGTAAPMTMENKVLEPPKEKPPPPPIEEDSDNDDEIEQKTMPPDNDVFKRVNSTKRIKKEIRNKRSSFLGIEGGGDDDSFLEINVQPPPDMAAFLEEERRLERQLLLKAGFSDSSDAGDSRDSGVSENHSRQSSGPYSSEENENLTETLQEQDHELQEVLQKGEKRRSKEGISNTEEEVKMRNIERQIREQEEVVRVERELFQLEQEELKRQRESMMYHENLSRKELNHGAKMLMSANRNTMHELNNDQHYSNLPHPYQHQAYQIETDYRKSMPDLQYIMDQKRLPPVPPAKPLRAQFQQDYMNVNAISCLTNETCDASNYTIMPPRVPYSVSQDEYVQIRSTPQQHSQARSNHNVNQYANMTKHTLHALSATPKPKLTNDWVQHRRTDHSHDLYQDLYRKKDPYLRSTCVSRNSDTWVQNQYKRRSDPQNFNYSNHWLIQEAEQRRLAQQRGPRTKKPLPESVIQTITQRVQSLGIGERRRPIEPSISVSNGDLSQIYQEQDRVLSVSGKKKCSHCGKELGRGAAMIIESLRLFYHIDCFKCSVCCSSLGDGLGGTDVRVRNSKLHCQSCYSSDDGVKFSCV